MRVYKKNLPEGVRSKFEVTIGRKIKIVNKLYDKKAKTKTNNK
ncbi:MAG: hypothetical protein PHS98_03645 [Bacilli bacterium]|nr:hypothetical protein [Bacilli bacterium]